MKIGIMQPYFFPYIGYFQLMHIAEKWIIFDEVQFSNKGWINRNRILHPDHKKDWSYINIPLSKSSKHKKICDVSIKSGIEWRESIFGKLSAYKSVAPYYDQTIKLVGECIRTDETNL